MLKNALASPGMLKLISRKLVQGILMLLVVSAATFALLSAAGGDALATLSDNPQISEKTIADLREHYGLDRPLASRYLSWLGSALAGDLGESISFRTSVRSLTWARLLNTAVIGLAALALAALTATFLGLASVRYKRGPLPALADAVVVVSATIPAIVLAIITLVISARVVGSLQQSPPILSVQFGLAAIALSIPFVALMLGQFRRSLIEASDEDFVRLAHAKGLDEWTVLLRHVVRAALNPFLTVTGLSIGSLLGGAVIVETIMGWPGIGSLMVAAVKSRDVPLVMGIVLFSSAAVWFGNMVAEILQVINDKRLLVAETANKAH